MSNKINNAIPYNTISGLQASVDFSNTLTITPGSCTDQTSTSYIVVSNTLTINPAVTGANGIDTGTFAENVMYSVYVIWGVTNPDAAGLISLSSQDPVLPSGYIYARLVGYACTQSGSATFSITFLTGQGNYRKLSFFESDPDNQVGPNYSISPTVSELSLAQRLPPIQDPLTQFVPVMYLYGAILFSGAGLNRVYISSIDPGIHAVSTTIFVQGGLNSFTNFGALQISVQTDEVLSEPALFFSCTTSNTATGSIYMSGFDYCV